MSRNLDNRTLGELAEMRDTLIVARRDIATSHTSDAKAIRRILDVLDSIVLDTPFYMALDVREAVAFRPKSFVMKTGNDSR